MYVFEFKNLRPGRAIHYFKRIAVKLPTPTKVQFASNLRIKYEGQRATNPLISSFW